MSPEEREAYMAEQRRHKRRVWIEADWGGRGVVGYVFGSEVSSGGWAGAERLSEWMTKAEIEAAEKRALERCYATNTDTDEMTRQCGGCRWFAALNGDWGFCLNEASPHDGRAVFEHGGCPQHIYPSELQP